ncbi:MAG: M61 family peptidase [Nevskiaceae bacterium]|nr:MAG: M61 family peptidase [Nevskiaceae bacterium]
MKPAVRYTVVAADPRAHLFAVTCTVGRPDPAGQGFRLPSWLRGSYLVRDFAKHVQDLRAQAGGKPVVIERLDKRSFRCAPVKGALTIEYRVYSYDESVRKAYLDTRRGFFNASSLCYCPAGCEQGGFEIEIRRPEDALCRGWRLATTLKAKKIGKDGFGVYVSPDYEDLIDHPVELGDFERIDFDVDGIPHALVLAGRYELDRERVARDLAKICHVERELFGQQPKLDEYLFLTNVVGAGYGGLEHRSSTALICSRNDLPRPGESKLGKDYRGFLGLCSHEYFHLWNVKRITAQRFLQSDLGAEAYTRDLWHYEGVTSYYDDLFLLRAGILDAAGYLDVVAENATRLQRTPGREVQTLADASFEAWIKYYQPDENTPNATVSYYVKGGLAAMCLDLTLRLESSVTLDDVLRALWVRYGARGIGVPEGGLEAVAQELSGLRLAPRFDRWLRSTAELPVAALLAEFGVEARVRAAISESDAGGRASGEPPRAYTGLKLRAGDTRVAQVLAGGPAARADVSVNDQLVALDGLRITAGGWAAQAGRLTPGRAVTLQLFRGDELIDRPLVPSAPPADTWTMTLAAARGPSLRRRKAWLGV